MNLNDTIVSRIPDVTVVLGPTTTGKSRLAVEIAKRCDAEIINADKFYLFDEFMIGTGRSDCNEHPDLNFHLYGILHPEDSMISVLTWGEWVKSVIENIISKGKHVIIEGSSFGLIDTAIRMLRNQNLYTWSSIGTKLCPEAISEVVQKRVNKAYSIGLLDETKYLLSCGLGNSWVMQKSVVYMPLIEYLNGECSFEAANHRIVELVCEAATMQWKKFQTIDGVFWLNSL